VKQLVAQSVRLAGEARALGIGEAQAPTTKPLLENPILLLQVRDGLQLSPAHPAADRQQ